MKNERGITLIGLIITMVLMLLLSAIVLHFALGDAGIFANTSKAKIMNKVQALDEGIKSYTLKSDNPYSASKKTVAELEAEGVLKKIYLENDKTIYLVNFDKDGKMAEKLGLEAKDFKIDAEALYKKATITGTDSDGHKLTTLENLQKVGIYVVDNDLNAAYLSDNKTYGKLINFGIKEEMQFESKIGDTEVKIIENGTIATGTQEVILVLDDTASMEYKVNQTVNGVTKQVTKISLLKNAMKSFCDIYFKDKDGNILQNPNRYMTIYRYYGISKNDHKIERLVRTNDYNVAVGANSYSKMTGKGSGTCTPNAMAVALDQVLFNSKPENNIQTDVIVMTDGGSNRGWDYELQNEADASKKIIKIATSNENEYSQKVSQCMSPIAARMRGITIDKHQTRVYGVAIGNQREIGHFRDDMGGEYDGMYEASDANAFLTAFNTIAGEVAKDLTGLTNASEGHIIQVSKKPSANGKEEWDNYSCKNVEKITIAFEANGSVDSIKNINDFTIVYLEGASGENEHELSEIYDKESGNVSLETAWIHSGLKTLNGYDITVSIDKEKKNN